MLIHKITLFVAIAFAAIALAGAPTAATTPESSSRSVRYADLDLSTPAGLRMLHRRTAAAVEAVCGSYAGTESDAMADENDEITQCRAAARTRLNEQLQAVIVVDSQTALAR